MKKRVALSILAIIVWVSNLASGQDAVHFADPILKAAVEQALGVANPRPTDMLSLTSLFARDLNVADLTGLEYATNLGGLYLENNRISDISPLSALTNLRDLYLYNNLVSDISALAGLTNLSGLGLSSNTIRDISALSGLVNLRGLYLERNQIRDISALSALTNLQDLFLSDNQIVDISWLAGLRNLRSLALTGNPLNQAAYSTYIPAIRQDNPGITIYCDLSKQEVVFADPKLKALVEQQLGISSPTAGAMLSLTSLFARDLGIVDLTGLEYATNLSGLYLENNRISDISPLSALTNLRDLYLYNNLVSDISALAGLTSLSGLGLSSNAIRDISALSGLVNLKGLYLERNQVRDISALSGLVNVEQLFLAGNQIDDISPVSGLTSLKTLALGGNPLNQEAHDIHIPRLCRNNPGITLYYDPPGPVQVPRVRTLAGSAGRTTARLRGQVDSDGGQVCEYRFRYKKDRQPYSYTPWNRSVTTGQPFDEILTGLSPEATWSFGAQVRNSAGESEWGEELSVTTLAALSLPPGCQAVEGFSSIAGFASQGHWDTYRGQATHSYWAYAAIAHDCVEWTTAPVPLGYSQGTVTFIWSGANGVEAGSHDLYLNGVKILTFDADQATDRAWQNGNYELFFDFKNHRADNAGVYYLTVPCSVVAAGRGSTIKVESVPGERRGGRIMIHDLADTIEYEMVGEQLHYDHVGRADRTIAGNCSDGIQNGDETGVDCGGSCVTSDPEVCNGLDDNRNGLVDEDVKFTYGHYYVRAALCLASNAMDYVRDVNDFGFPVLVDVLGFTPEIDMYIVDITAPLLVDAYYTGLRTVDGVVGGYIALLDGPIKDPNPFPRDMCYDLLYETIHGLTEPLKRNIHTYEGRHGVMARGEDFDIIFEVEALARLGATACADELRAVFYDYPAFPHFPVYYDIRERYGWEPIKEFLITLNAIKDEIHVNTDDDECYYLSMAAEDDLSAIYEAHGKTITSETKNRIANGLKEGR